MVRVCKSDDRLREWQEVSRVARGCKSDKRLKEWKEAVRVVRGCESGDRLHVMYLDLVVILTCWCSKPHESSVVVLPISG